MRMIQTFHSDYSVEQVKMLLSSLCEKFSFIIPTEGRIGYNLHGPFLTLIYVPKEMRMVRKYKALLLQTGWQGCDLRYILDPDMGSAVLCRRDGAACIFPLRRFRRAPDGDCDIG